MPEIPIQQQPTPNQKSINRKRILIVAVIGAVVVGLGVLIFFILRPIPETPLEFTDKKSIPPTKISTPSAKKDETAGWQIFSSNLYKYSLKYSGGFEVFHHVAGSPSKNPKEANYVNITDQENYRNDAITGLKPPSQFIEINIHNKNNIDLSEERFTNPYYHDHSLKSTGLKEIAEFTREENLSGVSVPKSVSKVKDSKISDQTAYVYQMLSVPGFSGLYVSHILGGKFESLEVAYTEHQGNIFEIVYTPTTTVRKILSTFKFLD